MNLISNYTCLMFIIHKCSISTKITPENVFSVQSSKDNT